MIQALTAVWQAFVDGFKCGLNPQRQNTPPADASPAPRVIIRHHAPNGHTLH